LGKVGVHQLLNGFGLYNHLVVHNQIHPIGSFNEKTRPFDVYVDFTQNLMAIHSQGMGQAKLVGILQESRPQGALNLDRCPDDGLGDFLMGIVIALMFPPKPRHTPSFGHEVRIGYAMFQSVLFSATLREISVSPRLLGCRMFRNAAFGPFIV